MTSPIDPVELASRLIACPSVTPASGRVFDVLEEALLPLGFDVHRFVIGEAPDGPVENLVAMRGTAARISALPAISTSSRRARAGAATLMRRRSIDGLLIGRGANDMKSAIAAFVAAASRVRRASRHLLLADHRRRGRPGDLRHPGDHRLADRA